MGVLPERRPYRPCTRCGLLAATGDAHECRSCTAERGYLEGRSQDVPERKCPVCGRPMSESPDWETSRLLICRRCSAVFGITDARLYFQGCNRSGKGTSGTNMRVRNDARRLCGDYVMFGLRPGLSPEDLLRLVLDHPLALLKEEALIALWRGGHTEQMGVVAAEAETLWAERAREGLEHPLGGPVVPAFFVEKPELPY